MKKTILVPLLVMMSVFTMLAQTTSPTTNYRERNLAVQSEILENGDVKLMWDEVSEVISYKIYSSLTPKLENFELLIELDSSNLSHQFAPYSEHEFFYVTYLFDVRTKVKINEIFYNAEGADTGKEWIEIYNNSQYTVDLTSWKLLKEGLMHEDVIFTFPDFSMSPYSYVLVGESEVENTDFVTNLALYNGYSSTKAVRLVSSDEEYMDSVLYSEPNSDNLLDDNGNIATSFAPEVSPGNALIRYPDGVDTNNCEADFSESSILSPKAPNILMRKN